MNNPLYSTNYDENKYKAFSSVNSANLMNNSKISEISSSKSPLRSNRNIILYIINLLFNIVRNEGTERQLASTQYNESKYQIKVNIFKLN